MDNSKSKLKVMIIDDLKYITNSMSLFLQDYYTVIPFNDPKKAIAFYTANPNFHVLIIDMQMPVMPGNEFIKRVKEINPSQACIVITGFTQKENIELALQAGSLIRIIKKPFDLLDVLKTIKDIPAKSE